MMIMVSLQGGGCRRSGVNPQNHDPRVAEVELVLGMNRLWKFNRWPCRAADGATRATTCRSGVLKVPPTLSCGKCRMQYLT